MRTKKVWNVNLRSKKARSNTQNGRHVRLMCFIYIVFLTGRLNGWYTMDVHLPVQGWADARIGQSLEINISLTIAKS